MRKSRTLILLGCIVLLVALAGVGAYQVAVHDAQATTQPATVVASMAEPAATSFTFGAGGDHGISSRTSELFRLIGSQRLDAFFSLGDLSYDKMPTDQWCQFVKDSINTGAGKPQGDTYGQNYPFSIVVGNHERYKLAPFLSSTCLPDRLGATLLNSTSYGRDFYVDYPKQAPLARIIMAAPGLDTDYRKGSPAYQWLSASIDSARAAGIPWVIVGNHFNHITTGGKGDEVGPDYFNLLLDKRVDLILQGHDHTYQRSKQLATGTGCTPFSRNTTNTGCITDSDGRFESGKGSVLVIDGIGGESVYPVSATDPEAGYFAKIQGKGPAELAGFTRFEVNATAIKAQFVGTSRTTLRDQFTLEKPASKPPAPQPPPAPELRSYDDTFTAPDGSSWPAAWSTGVNSGMVSVLGNSGRLAFNDQSGAFARATLTGVAPVADAEVKFSYSWSATGAASYANVFLRGSGGWQNAYRPKNGLGIEMSSESPDIKIFRALNGVNTTLGTFVKGQQVSTKKQWVRMLVSGHDIKLKTWADGTTEPTSWSYTRTDSTVTGTGQFYVAHARSGRNIGPRTFAMDDITFRQR